MLNPISRGSSVASGIFTKGRSSNPHQSLNLQTQISQTIPVEGLRERSVLGPDGLPKVDSVLSGKSGLHSIQEINKKMELDKKHTRKASPEAIALMMVNLKNNEIGPYQTGGSWMPGGGGTLKRNDSQKRNLFY